MDPTADPAFKPHLSTTASGAPVDPDSVSQSDLGPLAQLIGNWAGPGFNAIWTPSQSAVTGSDHFLQLNQTTETLEFTAVAGKIPNRGLLQGDLLMAGLRYLQQISENGKALHVETGMWLSVPATTSPPENQTVARLASIPHGTSLVAQGNFSVADGAPTIPAVDIKPFSENNPSAFVGFAELDVTAQTVFRTPDLASRGITQATLDNPNSLLTAAIAEQTIRSTTTLAVSSSSNVITGSGTTNTAFLGPNATASQVTASFWLETVADPAGGPDFLQLQYSQTVLLDFAGISWPHVSVATLKLVTSSDPAPEPDPAPAPQPVPTPPAPEPAPQPVPPPAPEPPVYNPSGAS